MTTLINTITPKNDFSQTGYSFFHPSTTHRMASLIEPIQQTSTKQSDITGYFLTPVIDYFILEPVLIIDFYIEVLNSIASLAKAAYLWIQSQQQSDSLLTPEVTQEFNDALQHGGNSITLSTASILNHLISTLALFTRPIASLVHACSATQPTQEEIPPQGNAFALGS